MNRLLSHLEIDNQAFWAALTGGGKGYPSPSEAEMEMAHHVWAAGWSTNQIIILLKRWRELHGHSAKTVAYYAALLEKVKPQADADRDIIFLGNLE